MIIIFGMNDSFFDNFGILEFNIIFFCNESLFELFIKRISSMI